MGSRREHRPRTRALAGMALAAVLLAGCGEQAPRVVEGQPAVPRHATVQVGDVTIRANVLRTSALDAEVAARYGITRADDSVLLLVGVRRGNGAAEVPMAAQVSATVTDLRGQRRQVEIRELHGNEPSGETVLDYFGTVQATPPETLRFAIAVDWPGSKGATLRVDHELRPD